MPDAAADARKATAAATSPGCRKRCRVYGLGSNLPFRAENLNHRQATAAATSPGCRKRCSSDVRSLSVK